MYLLIGHHLSRTQIGLQAVPERERQYPSSSEFNQTFQPAIGSTAFITLQLVRSARMGAFREVRRSCYFLLHGHFFLVNDIGYAPSTYQVEISAGVPCRLTYYGRSHVNGRQRRPRTGRERWRPLRRPAERGPRAEISRWRSHTPLRLRWNDH